MKKFLVIFFVVCFPMVVLGFTVPEDVQVMPQQPYAPSTGVDSRDLTNLVKKNSARVKALQVKADKLSAAVEANTATVSANIDASVKIGENVEGLTKAVDKSIDEQRATGRKVESVEKTFKTETKNLREQGTKNTWLVGGLILLVAIIVIAIVRISARRTREEVAEELRPVVENGNRFVARAEIIADAVSDAHEEATRKSDELLTEVRMGFAEMRTSFTELPAKVAKAVQTLDASPFEFEVAGHQVTYQSPAEGIAEGYYLLLHVPKDEVGDAATYERSHETSRGVARRNCRKTMQKYFEGDFKAPEYQLQRELIGHLIATGDLIYRKIS